MTVASGERLGPYEVIDLLGSGGMGEVYRARDPRLGRDVAVKVVSGERTADARRIARFEREARAVAALNHPNVLSVYDVGTHDGAPYVVTELLEGETLRQRLDRGRIGERPALALMLQAARGLEAAHARGIVHRDLKPENLFVTREGRVKVLDFGLAKLRALHDAGSVKPTESTATGEGVLLGTVGYMSPEQARGVEADTRSDVFSFGVVLYELLSGTNPFRRETPVATLSAVLETEPVELSSVAKGVSPSVAGIVRRCLEKEREARYASAHELTVALEAVSAAASSAVQTEEEERSPYPGLRSFTERDAGTFFGREAEVEALWERVRSRRLSGVIGPSGSGKTSFARAGLLASLPSGWGALVATPGAAPFRGLGQALVPELAGDVDALQRILSVDDPAVAFDLVGRWRDGHGDALLVVDQFEELFTLNPQEVQERFAALLGRLAREADVHVLLSLRDDFLMRCADYAPLAKVFESLFPLPALSREGLGRALVEPARSRGYRFADETLVEEMVSSVEGSRAALPLLAFAVSRLWEKRDREQKLLRREAYEVVGGVAGALAQHAEETLERIGSERQGMVREVFRTLVTAQGTRAVAEREQVLSLFPDRAAAEEVLGALVDARLLTSYEVEGGEEHESHHRVEIAHESLVKAWPRLVRWQAQDEEGAVLRDQLKQAAHLWEEKERSEDLLWTGTAYQEYALWRGRYPGALTALEEEFAAAMAVQAARQRRRRRLAAGLVLTAAVVVAAITGALWRRSEAARERARAEALRAEAGKLLALAQVRLEDDSTAALAFARESLDLHDTPEARRFVLEVLWRGPVARLLDLSQAARAVGLPAVPENFGGLLFSPDGRWLVGGYTGPVLLFDRDGGPTRMLSAPFDTSVIVLGFGPRSDVLVRGGPGASLRFWSAPDLRERRTVPIPSLHGLGWGAVRGPQIVLYGGSSVDGGLSMRVMGFSDEGPRVRAIVPPGDLFGGVDAEATHAAVLRGRHLAWLSLDETNRRQPLGELPADFAELAGFNMSLRGDLVVVSDISGQTRAWSRSEGGWRLLRALQGPAYQGPTLTLLDRQGRWISQAGPNGSHVLWDLEEFPDAEPLVLRRPGLLGQRHGSFDPSGQWLAAGNGSRTTVEFWPVARPRRRVLPGLAHSYEMRFSPDSRWLTTCPFGQPVRQWPLNAQDGAVGTFALGEHCLSVAVHPASRDVLVGTSQDGPFGQVVLYPSAGGAPRRLVEHWEGASFFLVALDPRGRRAVAVPGGRLGFEAPESRALVAWDTETWEKRVYSVAHLTDGSWRGWIPAFAPDGRLYVGGWGGIQRLTLPTDASGSVSRETIHSAGYALPSGFSRDGRQLLVAATKTRGKEAPLEELLLFDTISGTSRRVTTHGARLSWAALSPSGRIIVTGDHEGVVRVGPASGGEPHLLLGHKGRVVGLAISPDERWVASSSDESISIWPMPDVTQPPLHTLPHEELMAKLDALTNLRIVRDPASATGWKEEIGAFPGWKDVPTW